MSSGFEMTHTRTSPATTHTHAHAHTERTRLCSAQVFPLTSEAAGGHTSCGSHRGEVTQTPGENSLILKRSNHAAPVKSAQWPEMMRDAADNWRGSERDEPGENSSFGAVTR